MKNKKEVKPKKGLLKKLEEINGQGEVEKPITEKGIFIPCWE
ncbi:MAG: hypothetical protein PHR47_04225 [Candidatus Pacebacteria bacterium]|nr:hypothetical protein [Candidatus Paceibacterota bacterium]